MASCSGAEFSSGDEDSEYVDALASRYNRYTRGNNWDSLFRTSYSTLYTNQGAKDTVDLAFAALYNAQYFLFVEQMDSLKFYLDMAKPYQDYLSRRKNPLEGLRYTLEGYYMLKSSNDFVGLVSSLLKSYDSYCKHGYIENAVVPLANVVNFYWVRSDISGMEYAKKAYLLTARKTLPDYYRCLALISMAEMLSLSDNPDDAMQYVETADSIVTSCNYVPYIPILATIRANVLHKRGMYAEAMREYERAISYECYSEPAVVVLICLRYGELCEQKGFYDRAASLYRRGLDISSSTESMELRSALFLRMAHVEYALGNGEAALDNYRSYFSLHNSSREWKLNDLRMKYRQISYDHELRLKEIALLKTNRKMLIIVFAFVIIALIALFLVLFTIRQRKLYQVLVNQYRNYVQSTTVRNSSRGANDELWNNVNRLMSAEKLFLRSDLTLESLAKEAGTNRTYLSRTINTFSGKNFSSYVDGFRIREATRIIEASKKSVSFKQIAEMVGYTSVPVFYKAFVREVGLSPGRYRDDIMRRKA